MLASGYARRDAPQRPGDGLNACGKLKLKGV